jgi:hypothetical protein
MEFRLMSKKGTPKNGFCHRNIFLLKVFKNNFIETKMFNILLSSDGHECGWFIGISAVIALFLARYGIISLILQVIFKTKTTKAEMIFWLIVFIFCVLMLIFT